LCVKTPYIGDKKILTNCI